LATVCYPSVLALIVGFVGWITLPTTVKWAAPAIALALFSLGLGINSLVIALHSDRRTNEVSKTLTRIEDLQIETSKELKERSNSGSPILPTLQTFSHFYLDYLAKQKSEKEKLTESNDVNHPKEARNEKKG
jgi:hypothetical protein